VHCEYHAGELEVPRRARVEEGAQRLSGSRHAQIPESAKGFLEDRRFIVYPRPGFVKVEGSELISAQLRG